MKVFKRIVLTLIAIILLLIAVSIAYYIVVTASVSLQKEKINISEGNFKIYDNNEQTVASLSVSSEKSYAKSNEIPTYVKNAFISIEDKRFFSHSGIDFLRLSKALLNNLRTSSFGEGGSTISQQLIKNTHLTNEKTIDRKLKEIKLTMQLEKEYSKDEILEMYLNTIYFGHGIFGIQNASKYYFDKPVYELRVSEGAMLAGIIKAPNNYSPFKDAEKCLSRRDLVLSVMKAQNVITDSEYELAIKDELPIKANAVNQLKSYKEQVFTELDEICSIIGVDSLNSYSIYTYLDTSLQNEIEAIANNNLYNDLDKSIVLLDNKSHGIKAFYSTIGNSRRLPASIIKPLLVYAPALEEGIISPATLVLDEQTSFNGYSPANFNDKYYGNMSIREAIAQSSNVVAVKVLNELGISRGCGYMKKMNMQVNTDDRSLALALGGMKNGYTLKDLCGGFSTFACNGVFTQPKFVKEIRNEKGEIVYKNELNETKVYSQETTYLMNNMLNYTAQYGTARRLKGCQYDICAKTGTNGLTSGNADAYTIAYTTNDTFGIWLGKADGSEVDILGGREPCDIAFDIQNVLYSNQIPACFQKPSGVKVCNLDKYSYDNMNKLIIADDNAPPIYTFTDIFNERFAPTQKSNAFTKPIFDDIKISCDERVMISIKCNKNLYCIIKRKSLNNKVVLYNGKVKNDFLDDIEEGVSYVYSIQPYIKVYDEIIYGDEITLPEVRYFKMNDDSNTINEEEYDKIKDKNWWED